MDTSSEQVNMEDDGTNFLPFGQFNTCRTSREQQVSAYIRAYLSYSSDKTTPPEGMTQEISPFPI